MFLKEPKAFDSLCKLTCFCYVRWRDENYWNHAKAPKSTMPALVVGAMLQRLQIILDYEKQMVCLHVNKLINREY
jgi:uncharacterized membrane protein